MESVTVIYSPLCEWNGAFLSGLEEWLESKNVEIIAIPFDAITAREKGWYRSADLVDSHGHFKGVFGNMEMYKTAANLCTCLPAKY